MSNYWTVYDTHQSEIIVKKSRFIATIKPVFSKEEAEEWIANCKKTYYDAAHNCSAYIVGEEQRIAHSSDDREPSNTAGKPMLEVLLGKNLTNVCVVVTRYFGGTLLGTGGLVRAYQQAVIEVLGQSLLIEKRDGYRARLSLDYTDLGKVQYYLSNQEIVTYGQEFDTSVYLTVLIPVEEYAVIEKGIVELSAARVKIEQQEIVKYALVNKKIELF